MRFGGINSKWDDRRINNLVEIAENLNASSQRIK